MKKHIIFDCFGTLIDTGSGSVDAVKEILQNVGSDLDPEGFYSEWKKVKKEMMTSDFFQSEKKLFELSLSELFRRYEIERDASDEVEPMIKTLFGIREVFPEVKRTLQILNDIGIEYAIGSTTDTDSLHYFLKYNDLTFEHIYTSEEMKVYKPAKRFYQTILDMSGWNVTECLFVGDNLFDDIYGPQSIGMKAVLIDRDRKYSDNHTDIRPDYVINSLLELKNIVNIGRI